MTGNPWKPAHHAGNERKAIMQTVLLATFHQHLHPKADTEERNLASRSDYRGLQLPELFHSFPECTYPGEDYTFSREYIFRIRTYHRERSGAFDPS